jgi:hypothetical protein
MAIVASSFMYFDLRLCASVLLAVHINYPLAGWIRKARKKANMLILEEFK